MFEAWVTQTSLVRGVIKRSSSSRSTAKVSRSMLQNLNTTPRSSSASQGPMLDSWSKTVRITSSPGANRRAMAAARKRISTVVEGPSTTSSGREALTRRAILARASESRAVACCESG